MSEELKPIPIIQFLYHPTNGDIELMASEETSLDDLVMAEEMLSNKIKEIVRNKDQIVLDTIKLIEVKQNASISVLKEILNILGQMSTHLTSTKITNETVSSSE